MAKKKLISAAEQTALLELLKGRFLKNKKRHPGIDWEEVAARLSKAKEKMTVLQAMELTGGEPDVIGLDKKSGELLFCDCSEESPKGRRSLCYDRESLDARKEFKPANSALDMAEELGVELLDETHYRMLQSLGKFDLKTSSWLKTPDPIRKLGGAIFGDFRYGTVFIYHNGASSYYAARGFRGMVRV